MPIAWARTRASPAAGSGQRLLHDLEHFRAARLLHLDYFHAVYYGAWLTERKTSQMMRPGYHVPDRASRILRLTLLGAGLIAVPGPVAAQYPSKPLRIIVPFPPGAATDLGGRYLAQKLGESFGQQVIPDNRPGANGTIGLELAAKAPPDGRTLVLGQTGNPAISPGITKVGYDPARDFAPISLVFASPHCACRTRERRRG
jgi:hypothetical protein